MKALTDYTVLLAPYNALMVLFSRVNARPYAPVAAFPDLAPLQAHWEEIRAEALSLNEAGRIGVATGYNDIGFNSFFRSGWKRFYLKWYGEELASAKASCPRTVELLNSIPSIKGAMFASLPPHPAGPPPAPRAGPLRRGPRPAPAREGRPPPPLTTPPPPPPPQPPDH